MSITHTLVTFLEPRLDEAIGGFLFSCLCLCLALLYLDRSVHEPACRDPVGSVRVVWRVLHPAPQREVPLWQAIIKDRHTWHYCTT